MVTFRKDKKAPLNIIHSCLVEHQKNFRPHEEYEKQDDNGTEE